MRECSVPDCNVQNNFLTTFNVPTKDPDVRKQWIKFLKLCGKVVHENSAFSLCELHFAPADIVYGKYRKTLKHNSVPITPCSKQKVKQVESKLKKETKKEPIGDEISVNDHDYHSNGIFVERDELRRKVKLLEVLLAFEKKKNSKQSVTKVVQTKSKQKSSINSVITEVQELEALLDQEREKNAKLRDKLTRHLKICRATADAENLESSANLDDSEFMVMDEDTLDQTEVDLNDPAIAEVFVKEEPKFQFVIKNVK